jgi:hypothetical protein
VIRDLATTGLDVTLNDAGWDAVSADSFMRWLPPGSGREIQWDEGADRLWDLVKIIDLRLNLADKRHLPDSGQTTERITRYEKALTRLGAMP